MDWKVEVIERLTRIETNLKVLVGNGAEGVCSKRGREISSLRRIVYIGVGAATVLSIFAPKIIEKLM